MAIILRAAKDPGTAIAPANNSDLLVDPFCFKLPPEYKNYANMFDS
jgi:hypothetical protein